MRKARSYRERCEGALAYARAELNRIKVAHRAALQEFRELGNDLKPKPGDSAEVKRTKEWLAEKLIELPAEGHRVATMCDVLEEILVNGQVFSKKELAEE